MQQSLFDFPTSARPPAEQPGWKARATSRDAAESMKATAPLLRTRVLESVSAVPDGLTPDECAARLGLTVLSVRPRFTELAKAGKIKDSGERRENASGRRAVVWTAAR